MDGVAWQVVWQTGINPGVADSSWTTVSDDGTPSANPLMQVRIGVNVNSSGAFTVGQWNVDNLYVCEPSNIHGGGGGVAF